MGVARFIIGLLVVVTVGMLLGTIIQLAIIQKWEESSVNGYPQEKNQKGNSTLRLEFIQPEIISWRPRIILFHNFLGTEECDHLRNNALPLLEASSVIDATTGMSVVNEVRTSYGMFFSKEKKDHIVQTIEERIAAFTHVPPQNGEDIQVLRYQKGQYYRPHNDFFDDHASLARGGQRVATMLMYLNDNVEGGETYFPNVGMGNCSCGGEMMRGTCIKPIKGNAVLFWSMGLDGKEDDDCLHSGCAVVSGEKWSATKWLRQRVFH